MSRSSHQKRRIKLRLLHNGSRPCCFCRRVLTLHTATIEHVIPLSLGGGWKISNQERGVQDFDEFRRAKRDELARRAEQLFAGRTT